MKLEQLQVGELRAGLEREQQPAADRPGGLVVRAQSAAAPPVASTMAPAAIALPSSSCTPAARPPAVTTRVTRRFSVTAIRGCSATSVDNRPTIRRPVAAPPAWTTRLTLWPPSSPSA